MLFIHYSIPPEHERLYRIIASEQKGQILPIHHSIDNVINGLNSTVLVKVQSAGTGLDNPELLYKMGYFMQFSDHFKDIPGQYKTNYQNISAVFDAFSSIYQKSNQPISLDQQLNIVLELCNYDLSEALWLAWLSSRFYSRWLDSGLVVGIESFSPERKLEIMKNWQKMLLGFKVATDGTDYHDASGDTYYAWTHAISNYYCTVLSNTNLAKISGKIFKNGTNIMQTCVNSLSPRGIVSEHDIASRYGNAVGDACSAHAIGLFTKK